MTRAMEWLREMCGDRLILGCGVPLMPAFGLVDYCRVSCDVGLDWDGSWLMRQTHRERVSTRQAMANTIFRRELNGRAWLSDPDVFFLREENLKLTEEEKTTLATVNALFGGMLLCSDDMGKYGEKALAAYRRTLEAREAQNIRVIHNVDDPLISSADRKYLNDTLGSRIVWFDCGGHLGNLFAVRHEQEVFKSFPVRQDPVKKPAEKAANTKKN